MSTLPGTRPDPATRIAAVVLVEFATAGGPLTTAELLACVRDTERARPSERQLLVVLRRLVLHGVIRPAAAPAAGRDTRWTTAR